MTVMNDMDRYHLVIDVIDRVPSLGRSAAHLRQHMNDRLVRQWNYTKEYGDDPPEIRDWIWPH
jgi:xylulose-5-phosphate/fructose-6-phosphate phosphoketolase